MNFEILEGDEVHERPAELVELCVAAFGEFDPAYLTDRLTTITAPSLVTARGEHGKLAGFKLGYRRGSSLFYSWLGAVHPSARRQGLASALMGRQHGWAARAGYRQVETRTRAENAAMIVLNLKSGFVITGFETDRNGIGVVTQRKRLLPR